MKNKYIHVAGLIFSTLMWGGCNDYLDELPDNRTEVNTLEKIKKILVSAYPLASPHLLHEYMSDNYMDNGAGFSPTSTIAEEAYLFNDISSISQDSPYSIWGSAYEAIQAANTALRAIATAPEPDLSAYKGEALLCRAYAHFILCNTFCQAYNTATSSTDLGVPYIVDVESSSIESVHGRETVAEVYRKIDEHIEEGLLLLKDEAYAQPKYHFNKQAAYSFAAQFNLYYGDYDKAIKYATQALGETPEALTRDFSDYAKFTSTKEICNAWNDSELATNFLIQTQQSLFGRTYNKAGTSGVRYGHSTAVQGITVKSQGPWGKDNLYYGRRNFGAGSYNNRFPKVEEYFVYSDVALATGQPYVVITPFTADKTLINRAEAYAMAGLYDEAAADLSVVYVGGMGKPATAQAISDFYGAPANAKYLVDIHPVFPVNDGMQKNMVQACLHLRRIVGIHEGERLRDLKRFGARYTHNVDDGTDFVIEPFDKRLALQLPDLVISKGVTPNPR